MLAVAEIGGERESVERIVEIPARHAPAADEFASLLGKDVASVELERVAPAEAIPRGEIPFFSGGDVSAAEVVRRRPRAERFGEHGGASFDVELAARRFVAHAVGREPLEI